MPSPSDPARTNTRRAIVRLLKTEGSLDAARLAGKLGLTAMAVRQHLYALQDERLVAAESRPVPLGRPMKYWQLTRAADRLFPEAYAELSVALIGAMADAFGEDGLRRILEARRAKQQAEYQRRIPPQLPLKEKLQRLVRIRSDEGYMAELAPTRKGSFLLVENHCPICAAANVCQGFCTTELDLFQAVLGPAVSIRREEHILAGNRRCAYRISPRQAEKERVGE